MKDSDNNGSAYCKTKSVITVSTYLSKPLHGKVSIIHVNVS